MTQVALPFRAARSAPRAWGMGVCAGVAAGVVLLPVVYLLVRATGGGERSIELLMRWSTWALAARSVALACVVATASLGVAGALAWFTGARDVPLRRLWTVLAVAPLAAPCYLGASVYLFGLSPRGAIGSAWAGLGLGRAPELSGFWAAAFVLTLFIYPYAYLPLRSVSARLDRGAYEAARTLGRSPLKAFISGVAPQMLPAAVGGWLFVALYTLSEFGAVSLLRCETFTSVIYLMYTSSFDRAGAAVLSVLLVLIALGLLLASDRFSRRGAEAGEHERPMLWDIESLRVPAVGFAVLIALLTSGVTLVVAGQWLVSLQATARLWEAVANTSALALLSACVCVAAAWPIAWLVVRRRSVFGVVAERVSHTGLALPGVVVALGLAAFVLRTPFYQTWVVLLLAYLTMFLAQAVTPLRAGLGRVSVQAEEAARTLGRSRLSVFRSVTLPLAAPGVIGAWLLVLITTARELPATLLLAPTGVRTLASELWTAMSEAEYSRAAAPAIALLLVSCAAVALVARREGLV